MSELIWKIKNFFRKLIPIGLIVGVCYGGFHAYQKGWFGRKLTHQISSNVSKWTRSIPFFGSKFSSKGFTVTSSSHRSSSRIGRASKKRHKAHGRRASRHGRRHRSRH